ncbi:MAG TPA: pyridoxamine 5-phosphate oxidase [Deltaproteobacteria bacterium]|nr:MAG: pyridoxamine 5-phosphate oxidase [Deltaproteobacteria bacterium GWA2_55_82]OGQ63142.1 MAG: pyridoxamine 5-phosphate oxidase [Deltaproteobacteria bacterium RIFCSPLOWO2_02_FULL_55_12]OIJ73607.1 MAG: pyridoxamine 5-phosphate oxidase [Deltaproteobacteria bacterium GWC2_55_46]HBG47744.1 pyridoxamine 5-phosphate oxidase [Deltaproteobacteria bacterium]HCY12034.1 pyridoxamine 5-phosphate oxidase [Deltaproteobacteria bacterium]
MSRFGLASSTWSDDEREAILEVVSGGSYTMGRHVREFEEEFASRFGMKYAVMVNSGSSANLISVASLFYRSKNPLKRGDEVIVPCISWSTTFHPLHQYGLKLRFVDVDLRTLNYDIEALKAAVTERTRMIVAVSILGNPCRFDEITRLCEEKGLILFEDNCESMGARFGGRYTGTFGLVNTFSTFFSHHISTMEGGLALTDDKEVYNLLKAMRNHGWTRDQDEDSPIFERNDDDFFEAYRFILPGYNLRPGEIHGAIGKRQLKKLDEFVSLRRKNAAHFVGLFKDDRRFIIQEEVGESSWFSFTMIVDPASGLERKQVLERLKGAGIEYRIITGGNILRHDVVRYYDYTVAGCGNADIAHYNGFFVGNHPQDIRDKIDHLYETLRVGL